MIQIDIRDTVLTLRREFKHLKGAEFDRAVARALNHVAAKAKTTASEKIRERYKIRAKDVRTAIVVRRAFPKGNPEAHVIATGRPIRLIAFAARQTKKGVTFNILGQRKFVKGAFIRTMKSGHKGVFSRGKYQSREFIPLKPRLPITELSSVSLPKTFMHQSVVDAMSQQIQSDLPKRLAHELRYVSGQL